MYCKVVCTSVHVFKCPSINVQVNVQVEAWNDMYAIKWWYTLTFYDDNDMMLSHAVMNTLWCTLSYTCYDAMMWWCILHYALYDVHVCHGVMTLSYVLWCILVDNA